MLKYIRKALRVVPGTMLEHVQNMIRHELTERDTLFWNERDQPTMLACATHGALGKEARAQPCDPTTCRYVGELTILLRACEDVLKLARVSGFIGTSWTTQEWRDCETDLESAMHLVGEVFGLRVSLSSDGKRTVVDGPVPTPAPKQEESPRQRIDGLVRELNEAIEKKLVPHDTLNGLFHAVGRLAKEAGICIEWSDNHNPPVYVKDSSFK